MSYRRYRYSDPEVTKREIIFSIVIVCIMLIIGIIIHGKIENSLMEKYQKYNTALQINEDKDLFQYGMRTNVGDAFIYGDLQAVGSVTFPEIPNGQYGSVTRVQERYTKHTRTVTKTKTVNGKEVRYEEEEEYWTWDEIDRDYSHVDEITFLDVTFPWSTIPYPGESYITTQSCGYHLRYQFYGSDTSYKGTIYTNLSETGISDTHFYNNLTIEKTIDHLESGFGLILFWILWILLTIGLVVGFYYIDNRWLED